jgi:hypothetical protein
MWPRYCIGSSRACLEVNIPCKDEGGSSFMLSNNLGWGYVEDKAWPLSLNFSVHLKFLHKFLAS